jgi:hypothetical protein
MTHRLLRQRVGPLLRCSGKRFIGGGALATSRLGLNELKNLSPRTAQPGGLDRGADRPRCFPGLAGHGLRRICLITDPSAKCGTPAVSCDGATPPSP